LFPCRTVKRLPSQEKKKKKGGKRGWEKKKKAKGGIPKKTITIPWSLWSVPESLHAKRRREEKKGGNKKGKGGI